MKCQKCTKAATLHITEVVSEDQFEELHLCEECANKYLYEPQQKGLPGQKGGDAGLAEEGEDIEVVEMTLERAAAMIANGEIVDAKTVILVQYLTAHPSP